METATKDGGLQELLDLSSEEQERLLKRLTHHALCKMRRLTWRGTYIAHGGSVPGGYEPYDFALDAIGKALDGTRPWNREAYKTLEGYLRATIDSDISHLVESIDNKTGRRLSPPLGKDETASAYEFTGTEPDPVTVVIDQDWQARFRQAAVKDLKGEKFLIELLECMEAEITAPKEIAEVLGTSVERVNNEKKRLRRRLAKLDARIRRPRKGAWR